MMELLIGTRPNKDAVTKEVWYFIKILYSNRCSHSDGALELNYLPVVRRLSTSRPNPTPLKVPCAQ